jgi:hypothetical protein
MWQLFPTFPFVHLQAGLHPRRLRRCLQSNANEKVGGLRLPVEGIRLVAGRKCLPSLRPAGRKTLPSSGLSLVRAAREKTTLVRGFS